MPLWAVGRMAMTRLRLPPCAGPGGILASTAGTRLSHCMPGWLVASGPGGLLVLSNTVNPLVMVIPDGSGTHSLNETPPSPSGDEGLSTGAVPPPPHPAARTSSRVAAAADFLIKCRRPVAAVSRLGRPASRRDAGTRRSGSRSGHSYRTRFARMPGIVARCRCPDPASR